MRGQHILELAGPSAIAVAVHLSHESRSLFNITSWYNNTINTNNKFTNLNLTSAMRYRAFCCLSVSPFHGFGEIEGSCFESARRRWSTYWTSHVATGGGQDSLCSDVLVLGAAHKTSLLPAMTLDAMDPSHDNQVFPKLGNLPDHQSLRAASHPYPLVPGYCYAPEPSSGGPTVESSQLSCQLLTRLPPCPAADEPTDHRSVASLTRRPCLHTAKCLEFSSSPDCKTAPRP